MAVDSAGGGEEPIASLKDSSVVGCIIHFDEVRGRYKMKPLSSSYASLCCPKSFFWFLESHPLNFEPVFH